VTVPSAAVPTRHRPDGLARAERVAGNLEAVAAERDDVIIHDGALVDEMDLPRTLRPGQERVREFSTRPVGCHAA